MIWGISANSHDAALAVFDQNINLKFASQSERFSRVKNDPHLHTDLIDYAMQFGKPEHVVWYENPYKKTMRQLLAGQGWNAKENNVKEYLCQFEIKPAKISYVDHHCSHAAAGFNTSGFVDATVVCIDSVGEFETLTVWSATHHGMKKVYSQRYPHSVGMWYSAMTQRVGLKPQEDEYILMGMAAYGDGNRLYHDVKQDFVEIGNKPMVKFNRNLHRGCKDWRPDLTSEQDYFDIAAATQLVYEDILRHILGTFANKLPSNNLVLMGGCALNCSANSIAYEYFKNVWVMPNPGDSGSAIGAVLAHYKKKIKWPGPYLGYNIEGTYPVNKILLELVRSGICGVANGRSEFGPRALGNRSLFADPRGADIKDRVNDIKLRQRFRPFAPVILEEHANDFFTGPMGPYMQFTARCRYPETYPAIVHGDGTSRVQTVGKRDSPDLHGLLERWYELTGCPMLLNTSLNVKGQPIVNTRLDAIEFEKQYNVKVY